MFFHSYYILETNARNTAIFIRTHGYPDQNPCECMIYYIFYTIKEIKVNIFKIIYEFKYGQNVFIYVTNIYLYI